MIRIDAAHAPICVIEPQADRLTAANAAAFKEAVVAEVEAGRTLLVIDLAGTTFVDSSGLGALVGVLKRVGARGEVALCGLSPNVAQMVRLTRMDQVFAIHPNRDAAVAALRASVS